MQIRDEIERIIKEYELDRNRIHEVPKQSYTDIIKRTEAEFVVNGGLHRCWDGRLLKKHTIRTRDVSEDKLWYHTLTEIFSSDEPVYALLEDTKAYEPKYWVFETHLPEMITVLDEINGLDEFYLVSKKYKWLICETHEDIICCVGEIPAK